VAVVGERDDVVLEAEVAHGPTLRGIVHDQIVRVGDRVDAGLLQVCEAHAGGFQHGLFGRPEAEERLPSPIRQRPFILGRDVIREPVGPGRDLLDVDADGRGAHDGRHKPRLMRDGPEGAVEGKRGVAVALLQRPEADAACLATQGQRLA